MTRLHAKELVQGWKSAGAWEWRCAHCPADNPRFPPRILGYILDRTFLSVYADRQLTIALGGVAIQTCDRCGKENRYDPDTAAPPGHPEHEQVAV